MMIIVDDYGWTARLYISRCFEVNDSSDCVYLLALCLHVHVAELRLKESSGSRCTPRILILGSGAISASFIFHPHCRHSLLFLGNSVFRGW